MNGIIKVVVCFLISLEISYSLLIGQLERLQKIFELLLQGIVLTFVLLLNLTV